MKLDEMAKSLGAATLAAWGTFQAVNGHGTWQNTLAWTAGMFLVSLVGVYIVPNADSPAKKAVLEAGRQALALPAAPAVVDVDVDSAQGTAGL